VANVETVNVGDRAVPQWTWTVGTPPVATDPTQIVVKQQDTDGVESTITTASSPASLTTSSQPLARVSAGVFKLNPGVSLTKSGYWIFRAEGTGTAEAAPPDFVYKVLPSEFQANAGLEAWALVGLQETKDWLQQQNIEVGDELELVRTINDVSDLFQEESEREIKVVGTNPQTRYFDADASAVRGRTIHVGDLTSFTQVQILDHDLNVQETVASGDIISLPRNRRSWEPIRRLRFTRDVMKIRSDYVVSVAGTWGFPSIPGRVRKAVLDAVAQVIDRDVEHYRQDLSPVPSGEGQNVIVFAGRPQLLSLPPTALAVARKLQDSLIA
jgi:hypothetical protein